jgi:hypothetical protein
MGGNMSTLKRHLLNREARRRLPALYRQNKASDPLIYAQLSARNEQWNCYIAEGGRKGSEYEVFALFVGKYAHNWAQVPLRVIEMDISASKLDVSLATGFKPKRVSDLVGPAYIRNTC